MLLAELQIMKHMLHGCNRLDARVPAGLEIVPCSHVPVDTLRRVFEPKEK
jgi:hypothetical protein